MSEKQIKVISFIGGLVFFSIVVGVVLMKNERIRAEVEEQAMSLLKTTKSAINQAQYLVSKVGVVTGEKKAAQANSNKTEAENMVEKDKYASLWESAESQVGGFVKAHL